MNMAPIRQKLVPYPANPVVIYGQMTLSVVLSVDKFHRYAPDRETDMSSNRPSLTPAITARGLLRRARFGALGTVSHGVPHVSLVSVATDQQGQPVMLLSDLARHTQNIAQDSRASVMVEEAQPSVVRVRKAHGTDGATEDRGDPMTQGRLTVTGRIELVDNVDRPALMERFLARHPDAGRYAQFSDFRVYRLLVEDSHMVAGFGAIHDINPDQLLIAHERAEAMAHAEPDIIDHMNADHEDALRDICHNVTGLPKGRWRMTGIDCEGFDVMDSNLGWARHRFETPLRNRAGARAVFTQLARAARDASASDQT
tara:strand:- start:421 stop:1359 length:939 start_codon:yes stop_codon:yes gene_type:complete